MEKSARQIPGVVTADLNFATGVLLLEYDPAADPRGRVVATVRAAGHAVEPLEGTAEDAAGPTWWQLHGHDTLLVASGVLIAVGYLLTFAGLGRGGWSAAGVAFLLAVPAGGLLTARRAFASLKARSLDMNVLMSLAVIGAIGIGAFEEAATVIFLFSVGQWLEARALERTRRSIRDLVGLAPALARVRRSGGEVEVAPAEALLGDVLVVRPGERIALDGTVLAGESAVDESPITGESVPAEKAPGLPVFAGSLNTSGLLEVEVTALSADSTLARIIYLVEEAQAQRAPSQRLVDRFTRFYTPVVVALAVAVAVLPPLLGAGTWREWLYRSLVLLVVSCPCALVISTPVAIVSAITRATRDGVLVKGGAFLEEAAKVRAVAFDKTGTLTRGEPRVVAVEPLGGMEPERVRALAAALESGSAHPIARAVARAAGEERLPATDGLREHAGRGVTAVIDGARHGIGSIAFADESGIPVAHLADRVAALEEQGRSVLVLFGPSEAAGLVAVADTVRPEAAEIVRALRLGGVRHVVMLTGDNERTAAAIAAVAGVTEHRARLLPDGKVEAVRELAARYGTVAMVGDGVNDAPALAAAGLGIAMGAAGSDTALETADVALMAPDLRALPGFLALGRRTVRIIVENVVFSIAVKVVVLALALFGVASLWLAVFADMGVSLLVTANGLRLLRRRGA